MFVVFIGNFADGTASIRGTGLMRVGFCYF